MKIVYYLLRIIMFLCVGFGVYLLVIPADFTTAFLLFLIALILFSVSSIMNETLKIRTLRKEYFSDIEYGSTSF